ncbi:MAG: hypothetical protein HY865_10235 [Chloroflexi bacterium]|nr:hypothetical protein [Chloroflexota bacterium]
MSEMNRFSLMMDALTALTEVEQEKLDLRAPKPDAPTLSSVLAGSSPLPNSALFLGMAEDGLPVLLDLYDPVPGPILIVGDKASGKTAFLQMIARSTEQLHRPDDVQSGVITSHPDEWKNFQNSQSVVGVYSARENSALELLRSLVTWAHNNRDQKQTLLLLIDDLEAVIKLGQEAEQNLRWLLLRGPSRRVWPIITLNASHAREMDAWLEFFRTRLFGCIDDADASQLVTGSKDRLFGALAESQFTMREGNNWLNFWAPAID